MVGPRRPTLARVRSLTAGLILAVMGVPVVGNAAPPAAPWLGEELPLPLSVRTPRDLEVKAQAEKQYLIFNLLAGGKLAYDKGDYATAVAKWEALLRTPGLDHAIDAAIRPLAEEARHHAGGAPLPPAQDAEATESAAGEGAPSSPSHEPASGTGSSGRPALVSVSGHVEGGGSMGPGGSVIWLERTDGPTPRPRPVRGKVVSQRNKTFIPRVTVVPRGSSVAFKNNDDIFHNVFSLSRPNDFDTGLYRQGGSYTQTFRKAGPVQLLCNIHSSMIGYVYVVDTPYYGQADGSGAFTIRNVPPGEYQLFAWHELSSKPSRQKVTVGAGGVRGVDVRLATDRGLPAMVPDKSGKPRQTHLGY